VLYNESDIGVSKVLQAIKRLKGQNSETGFVAHECYLNLENVLGILEAYDLIVDASDNFPTRYLINDACVILKKPFIYGALHGFEGQLSVFNHKGGPTYRCLFPNMPKVGEVPNCNEHGVLGVIPGIVGNLQALEAVKVITGIGVSLSGTLLLFNGLATSFQKIQFKGNSENLRLSKMQTNYNFECETAFKSIWADGLIELLEMGTLQVIDVRSPEEFQIFHLDDSKNIPLSELDRRMHEINISSPIYFICQSGLRSQQALQQFLKFQPKATLVNVTGGINNLTTYAAKY
jgi:adenylyltransferase/sulfurtransferase